MPTVYPCLSPAREPWCDGAFLVAGRYGSSASVRRIFVSNAYGGPWIVEGAPGGTLYCGSVYGEIEPDGAGGWNVGQWHLSGRILCPAPGDSIQRLATWTDSGGTDHSAYFGTPLYYELIGFDGTATSGTANILGEANDPAAQQTTTWTYSPPKIWEHSGGGETRYSPDPLGLGLAGSYTPLSGGASGTLHVGRGVWRTAARGGIALWEDDDGTGLLLGPSDDGPFAPEDGGLIVVASDAGRGRWTAAMPTPGSGFEATWEWDDAVPEGERSDAPAALSFEWLGRGLVRALEDGASGRPYAYVYEAGRTM